VSEPLTPERVWEMASEGTEARLIAGTATKDDIQWLMDTNENLVAEIDRLRAEVERLTAKANDNMARYVSAVADAERLAEALDMIERYDVDWTQGVDENVEAVKDIAREALRQHEERAKKTP
jgi:hypothetical protein